MRKEVCLALLVIALIVGMFSMAHAVPSHLDKFNTKYGTAGSALDTCILCHGPSGPPLNPFGADFLNRTKGNLTFNAKLEGLDSDGDGFTNIVEINARTFPGDATSHPSTPPPPSDKKPPKITSFMMPNTSNSLTVSVTTLTATDNVGVTGYLVKESSTPPTASDAEWNPTPPTQYTFASAGKKTLYAWTKDAAGNISKLKKRTVKIVLTTVTTKAASTLSQASVTSAASRNRMASGMVQNRVLSNSPNMNQDKTNETPLQSAIASDPIQDMAIWVGTWFKVTMKNEGFYTGNSGLSNDRESFIRYLKIVSWNPENKVLDATLYEYDSISGQWLSEALPLQYISGNSLDFRYSSQASGDFSYGFTAQIKATMANGVLASATIKTLAGYHVQSSSDQASTEPSAGWLSITGKMIPESDVPALADTSSN